MGMRDGGGNSTNPVAPRTTFCADLIATSLSACSMARGMEELGLGTFYNLNVSHSMWVSVRATTLDRVRLYPQNH